MTNMGIMSGRDSEGIDLRVARARHMHALLTDERWTISKAAMRLGMTKSVLASRMNGSTAFLADEIEAIARELLKRDPIELYGEYLSVGPAGFEPTTSTVEARRFAPMIIANWDDAFEDEIGSLAPVTPIGAARLADSDALKLPAHA